MKLVAQKNFVLNGKYYFENDEIDIFEIGKMQDITRLNENGFIKPVQLKELLQIENELKQHEQENKIKEGEK